MADASSSKPEPKALRRPSPQPQDQSKKTITRAFSREDIVKGRWPANIARQRSFQGPHPALRSGDNSSDSSFVTPIQKTAVPERTSYYPPDSDDEGEPRESNPTAPSVPAIAPASLQRNPSTRRKDEYTDQDLTEVNAPAPVQDIDETSGWRKESYLEDPEARDDDGDDNEGSHESASPPPAIGGRRLREQSSQEDLQRSSFATQLYIVSYLIFFSILGTLARLGTQWLTFFPGAPLVTSVLWANVGGSLVMGFLSEDKRLFRQEWGSAKYDMDDEKTDMEAANKNHKKVKKTLPLYIGLATGFCGSFTSFSSFQRDVFLALSNSLPAQDYHPYTGTAPSFTSTITRNGGYSFLALLEVIFYTVGLSLAALFVGAHIAIALDGFTPTLPYRFMRRIVDPIVVFISFGCWLGAVFLAIWPPDRPDGPDSRGSWANEVWRGEVLFALVFAPVGCLIRYYASLKLNPISASFPLGTFAVNIFGCAIEAMCYDLQHVPLLSTMGSLVGGGRVGCQVLQGVMDGFCGCLTTVSTWVSELATLRRRHAYVYGFASVVGGMLIMIVIMGSVRWSMGFSDTACVTMRTSN